MKIGFHSNNLSLRGAEVALYDYADFNELLLKNESIVFTPKNAPAHDQRAFPKFHSRFSVHMYE